MSWVVVAEKDFHDSIRAKSIWAMTAIFVLYAGGVAFLYGLYGGTDLFPGHEEVNMIGFIGVLLSSGVLFVPIIGLLAGYKAIVGERVSGSMKLLHGLPHTRRDIMLGKLVGRSLVVTVPVLVGYGVAAIIALVMVTEFNLLHYVLFVLLTVLFAITYVSISVGISAATAAESRTVAIVVGLWLVLLMGWQIGITGLQWVINGFSMPTGAPPSWIVFLESLSPNPAYALAGHAFFPEEYAPNHDVFYLEPWVGVVVITTWLLIPATGGYYRFRSADL